MQLVDSHAHIDFSHYDADRDAMLQRAADAGLRGILAIGIGDGPEHMHQALALAAEYSTRPGFPAIYASAGIHPSESAHSTDAALATLAELTRDPRCIAVGEIGLDYYHAENPPIDVQQRVFIEQMSIAAAARLPILIHCRTSDAAAPAAREKFAGADAWADLLTLIEQHWRPTGLGGVMHCFSGSNEVARRSLDAGFLISFAGNITYPKAQPIRDAAAYVPLAQTLVETDAPFLAPVPHRGQRNEPAFVTEVAGQLAQIHATTPEAIGETTTANFSRLFLNGQPLA